MSGELPDGWPPVDTQAGIALQLEGMGFSQELAEQAVLGTQGQGLQAALDWLLQFCQTPRAAQPAAVRSGSE